MNKNAHYWLNRVAVKLYKDFMSGMDFENYEHRWLFDWDENLDTEANLDNVAAEDKALIVLAKVGAIRSSSRDNYFRDQQHEAMEKFGRGAWGERWEKTDPAHREYDYIRYIDDLNYDKFIEFCVEQSLIYKEEALLATLEIINEAPVVHVGEKVYILKTLQSGSPLTVVKAAYDHADIRFGFSELRQWTNKNFTEQKRFTSIFRKNEFSEGKELNPFVDIAPQTFMLKKQAFLTPQQLALIQKVSTN